MAGGGMVAGRRLRGSLRTALAALVSARLEAIAPVGQPLFFFVARSHDATLLLPREGRVLEHGPPAALLEAVTGVPVDAVELRETLTGCTQPPRAPSGRSLGPHWRIVPVGSTGVYPHRGPALPRLALVSALPP